MSHIINFTLAPVPLHECPRYHALSEAKNHAKLTFLSRKICTPFKGDPLSVKEHGAYYFRLRKQLETDSVEEAKCTVALINKEAEVLAVIGEAIAAAEDAWIAATAALQTHNEATCDSTVCAQRRLQEARALAAHEASGA